MAGLFAYDAVSAKCRCLIGKLLTREEYSALASQKTLAGAVAYLKEETSYSDLLSDIEPANIHRARLEQLLEGRLVDVYIKLYTFTSGPERRFIGHLLEELEIRYLLDAIRATEYDDSMEFYSIPPFIRSHTTIDFARIFRTDSKAEILEALRGTEYYELLYPLLSDNKSRFSQIEAEINQSYYKKLMTSYTDHFDKDQKKRIRAAISARIDLLNLSVILRIRRFKTLNEGFDRVKLDFTAILPLLIPIFGRFGESEIVSICSDELTLDETLDRFAELYRKPVGLFYEQNATGNYGSAFLYRMSRGMATSSKPSFDIVFGYLSLIRFENDNIIYILEALRYGVPQEKIEASIII